MTYLQAVNHVLLRLREDTVTSISGDERAELIGAFVNDAYSMAIEKFAFAGLHDEIQITTVSGTSVYTLDGAGPMGYITQLYDSTNNRRLHQADSNWINRMQEIGTASNSDPIYYAFDEVATDIDPKIVLYPTPDGAYTLTAQVELDPTLSLTNNTDVLKVPSNPVVKIALYMAREERGDLGQAPGTVEEYANNALATAVITEIAKRPELGQWDNGYIHRSPWRYN